MGDSDKNECKKKISVIVIWDENKCLPRRFTHKSYFSLSSEKRKMRWEQLTVKKMKNSHKHTQEHTWWRKMMTVAKKKRGEEEYSQL